MKHLFLALLLFVLSCDLMAIEYVLPNIERLMKNGARQIISNKGKDVVLAPKGFLRASARPPLQNFASIVQQSADMHLASVNYIQSMHPGFKDPRQPFEIDLSCFKREQLVLEMDYRPRQLPPLTLNNLDVKRIEANLTRYIMTGETDVICSDHEKSGICIIDVGVSVAVILVNTKTKSIFGSHVMEASFLDGVFKRGVEEICKDSAISDLQVFMVTSNIAPEIVFGIQNRLSKFFETQIMPGIKQQIYMLAPRLGGINISYDPKDNSLFLMHPEVKFCFSKNEEIEFFLRNAVRSSSWFQSDFSDRTKIMNWDDRARINHYFNVLNYPFFFFENMSPLGVHLEHPELQFAPTTKESVIQHYFGNLL